MYTYQRIGQVKADYSHSNILQEKSYNMFGISVKTWCLLSGKIGKKLEFS